MASSLAIPSHYFSIACAHVGSKFNVCVLEKDGNAPIRKSTEHSWVDVDQQDVMQSIRKLASTCLNVGELQIKAQSHLPINCLYPLHILVSLHDSPEEVIDRELLGLDHKLASQFFNPDFTIEKKGQALLYKLIASEINGGRADFSFQTYTGSFGLPKQFAEGELDSLAELLGKAHQYLGSTDELEQIHGLTMLKMFADTVINDALERLKKNMKQGELGFLGLSHPVTEYLNHPILIAYMKSKLQEAGINPDLVDIKFPSDEESDYYYNVMRPYMASSINDHASLIAILNDLYKGKI